MDFNVFLFLPPAQMLSIEVLVCGDNIRDYELVSRPQMVVNVFLGKRNKPGCFFSSLISGLSDLTFNAT